MSPVWISPMIQDAWRLWLWQSYIFIWSYVFWMSLSACPSHNLSMSRTWFWPVEWFHVIIYFLFIPASILVYKTKESLSSFIMSLKSITTVVFTFPDDITVMTTKHPQRQTLFLVKEEAESRRICEKVWCWMAFCLNYCKRNFYYVTCCGLCYKTYDKAMIFLALWFLFS